MIPFNIIANADDFGFDKNVTKAILRAYGRGYVNSISMMTNSDYFEEAVYAIKNYPMLKNVGIHINFTLGKPLTPINKRYLTSKGEWNRAVTDKALAVLDKQSRGIFYKEICCQIERALNAGVEINHLNSHHHVHVLPCFAGLFIKAARNYGLKLRLAQTSTSRNVFKNMYRRQLNKIIISNELHYSDYFEYPDKIGQGIRNLNGNETTEFMFHPVLNELGELTDHYDPASFSKWIRNLTNSFSQNTFTAEDDTFAII